MKRTVFGLLVMGSLVGVGSVGVYYAQGKLTAQAQAAEDSPSKANVREPKPIPVARQIPAAAQDPYAESAPQPISQAVDRYASDDEPVTRGSAARGSSAQVPHANYDLADAEPADAGQVQDVAAAEADPYAPIPGDDIPPADQIAAAPGPSPFASGRPVAAPKAKYPEQAVAAHEFEEPAPAHDAFATPDGTAGAPAAPRRLGAPAGVPTPAAPNPLRGNADPYGQASAEALAPADAPAGRYADSPFASNPGPPPAALVAEAAPLAAAPLAAEQIMGTGRPGDPQLNGAQAPALTIEKTAPAEIQIGKPAKFTIRVKNAGTATAHEVEVHDLVPQGTQLIDSSPPVNPGPEGELVWNLGSMRPGEEQLVEVQLMPTQEGEIGSVATVHFKAQASVRTVATKPMLNIEVLGPSKVNKGEPVNLRIKLSNPGSGAANGIMISEIVPQGLTHAAGRELEFQLGTLKPGETRELDLSLMAAEPGPVVNVIRADGEASLQAEAQTSIEIVAPELAVSLTGPKLRYLERNATHSISVSNPGTATAKNVDLVAVLPRTLKFVEANNGGQFDEATHAVYWNLEELPPQETGTVKLTTLPLEAGDAKLVIKGASQDGLKDEREEVVTIEGLSAINFQLSDLKDPIEVGGDTAYEVRVTNQGTKAASNVRVAVLVPQGMKPLSAEGPVRYQIEGQRILFEPLRQLAPKADTTYTIKVQATEVGDHRVDVQIVTDEIQTPVSKEESTRVYGDE